MTDYYLIINKINEEIEHYSIFVGDKAEAIVLAMKNLRQWIIEEGE